MKYYMVVQLRTYEDKVIGEHSCNCDTDISSESIIASARVAAELMVEHNLVVKQEQKNKGE